MFPHCTSFHFLHFRPVCWTCALAICVFRNIFTFQKGFEKVLLKLYGTWKDMEIWKYICSMNFLKDINSSLM